MIHVFKTTVNTQTQVSELKPYLDKLFPYSEWNFDLEDCDNVFRIESSEDLLCYVEFLFKAFDIDCEVLE